MNTHMHRPEQIRTSDSVTLEYLPSAAVIWLDSPHRPVNVMDAAMLEGLESALQHIRDDARELRWIALASRKPTCFLAGADVHRIAELRDEPEVTAILQRGHRLMDRIAGSSIPVIALLRGTCLGGGLELALACHYRIACADAATRLGLPEIRLGLIPGWGGTQRLPMLVGLRQALEMILTGRQIPAQRAQQMGLVDRLIGASEWETSWAQECDEVVANRPERRRRRSGTWIDQMAWGQWLVLAAARRRIADRRHHYPALQAAIDAVAAAVASGGRAMEVERRKFTQLIFTPTAQHLLRIFLDRDRARKVATWIDSGEEPVDHSIGQLAVIGGGTMGAGIAAEAVRNQMEVWGKEVDAATLAAARQRVEGLLSKLVDKKRIEASELPRLKQRLHWTTQWSDLAGCDLAIEAVVEVPDVKREVFQMADRNLRKDAVLASNTSSLHIGSMATATDRPSQVVGIHFFNPVDRMELVEVIRCATTSDATLLRALRFVRRLGKTPVVADDQPGFIVNRILFPYLGEAVRMVDEGWSVQRIDRAMRRFGMPMGPLELIDQVGIDIAAHVARSLASIQPDAEPAAALLDALVERRWLGKKSGCGFYRYGKSGRRRVNRGLPVAGRGRADVQAAFRDDGMSLIQRRLVYPMLNEAVHCLDDGVAAAPWIIDLAMVLGTGFAPMHGGPLRLIHTIGRNTVLHNMQVLEELYGSRFAAADGLRHASRPFCSEIAPAAADRGPATTAISSSPQNKENSDEHQHAT
ncbi:MAG: multifunctional fatty acid oxidation complex subunit alpha [Planctomycetota bacterium]|nr:MAG: multifunctional fatty acid oxidation complex subunit alpha [Planctomycetota bacterium]